MILKYFNIYFFLKNDTEQSFILMTDFKKEKKKDKYLLQNKN